MRVLDLAAGAGGKSLALAAAMRNEGAIVACDIRPGILDNLRERALRAGASIVSARLAIELRDEELFDIVLVDAPCSGTGTWRRQPELRWHLTAQRLAELNVIQDNLLSTAARHVRPGGRLVYATCSILPCENEHRIAAFLLHHPSFVTFPLAPSWRSDPPPGLADVFRATPLSTGTDGFFTAAMTMNA
jgi:16S rRNA (cytosine967-C5)-methyltransferase